MMLAMCINFITSVSRHSHYCTEMLDLSLSEWPYFFLPRGIVYTKKYTPDLPRSLRMINMWANCKFNTK